MKWEELWAPLERLSVVGRFEGVCFLCVSINSGSQRCLCLIYGAAFSRGCPLSLAAPPFRLFTPSCPGSQACPLPGFVVPSATPLFEDMVAQLALLSRPWVHTIPSRPARCVRCVS